MDWLGGWTPMQALKNLGIHNPHSYHCLVLLCQIWCSCFMTPPPLHLRLIFLHSHMALEVTWPMAMQTPHTGCWPGLCFNMEWRQWAVALILPPLNIRLDFFYGGMGINGTMKRNFFSFTSSIKLPMKPPLPVRDLSKFFSP